MSGASAGVRVLLIGGRSHAGKSSVARYLADELGWACISTDSLGRHPGRPWGAVPDHVKAHYSALGDVAILQALLVHQHGMWPAIAARVREQLATQTGGLVLEGSALMPSDLAALREPAVAAVWLSGSNDFIRSRIEAESGFSGADARARHLIDRFVVRNEGLDAVLRTELGQAALPLVEIDGKGVAEIAAACLGVMRDRG